MLFLLNNWKSILCILATAALAFLLHSLDVYRIEAQHRVELEAQAKSLDAQCLKEKAVTEGVSNDYLEKLHALNSRYDSLRVQHGRCVSVAASKPAVRDNATAAAELPRQDGKSVGLTSDALFSFARDAEHVRLQLLGCQSFITKTWELEGQR